MFLHVASLVDVALQIGHDGLAQPVLVQVLQQLPFRHEVLNVRHDDVADLVEGFVELVHPPAAGDGRTGDAVFDDASQQLADVGERLEGVPQQVLV